MNATPDSLSTALDAVLPPRLAELVVEAVGSPIAWAFAHRLDRPASLVVAIERVLAEQGDLDINAAGTANTGLSDDERTMLAAWARVLRTAYGW